MNEGQHLAHYQIIRPLRKPSLDGQHFVMVQTGGQDKVTMITEVKNWVQEFK